MDQEAAAFAALGNPSRLAIFRLLARRAPSDAPAGSIAEALGIRPNVLSVHLAVLARAGLIHGSRDGRQIRYGIDLARTGALIDYLALDCCRGRPEICAPLSATILSRGPSKERSMAETRPFNVLFICTGNSARSIFAESIMNKEGAGRFCAFSAGTMPGAAPNPLTIAQLRDLGHDVSGLHSKSVAVFQGADAPKLDFVFTVCDQAADEECPIWPGQPITGHWGVPDPAKANGTEAEKKLAFAEAYRMLRHRISAFVNLPFEKLDALALQSAVDRIGQTDKSPTSA